MLRIAALIALATLTACDDREPAVARPGSYGLSGAFDADQRRLVMETDWFLHLSDDCFVLGRWAPGTTDFERILGGALVDTGASIKGCPTMAGSQEQQVLELDTSVIEIEGLVIQDPVLVAVCGSDEQAPRVRLAQKADLEALGGPYAEFVYLPIE